MKTIQLVMMAATAGLLSLSAQAQEKKEKVCIKVIKNANGKECKVDSCFKSMEEAEACLKKCGMGGDIQMLGGTKGGKPQVIKIDSKSNSGANTTAKTGSCNNKTIVWCHSDSAVVNDDKEVDVQVDDKGNVTIKTGDGKETHVMTTTLSDSLLKELNIDEKISTDGKGTITKMVKVIIIKKVDVTDLSDNERKALPSGMNTAGKNKLNDLKVNASQGRLNINYSSQSKELVTINVFDTNGKILRSEKEQGAEGAFTKEMQIGDMPAGIYFIQIQQGDKADTKKVVISESSR